MNRMLIVVFLLSSFVTQGAVLSLEAFKTSDSKDIFRTKNFSIRESHSPKATQFELKSDESLISVNIPFFSLPESLQSLLTLVPLEKHLQIYKIKSQNLNEIASLLHQYNRNCGSLEIIDPSQTLLSAQRPTPNYVFTPNEEIQTMVNNFNENAYRKHLEFILKFGSRKHQDRGIEFSKALKQYIEQMPTQRKYTIRLEDHDGSTSNGQRYTNMNSVIVHVDPATKTDNSMVIFGAHADSISPRDQEAPGVDDDGSGVATNLTILETLFQNNFALKHPVEFHFYAAEEIGLIGSSDIVKKYQKTNANVFAMVQNDMNLFNTAGVAKTFYFASNDSTLGLTQFLVSVAKQYLKMDSQLKELYAGTSDHRPWFKAGYPAAFPFEDPDNFNVQIHTNADVLKNEAFYKNGILYTKLLLGAFYQLASHN